MNSSISKLYYNSVRRCGISSIIIDGYNLIGISHKDLRKQRVLLIESLISYRGKKDHEITVVFDGWRTGPGQENTIVAAGIKIIYSGIGENADNVIKRIISSNRQEWFVVTSDRDIAMHAWSSGSIPISSADFLNAVDKTGRDILQEDQDDKEETATASRKGNPRKLSKKERAVRRALSKL
jgi:predicted RNA-binding protein with PIN domain